MKEEEILKLLKGKYSKYLNKELTHKNPLQKTTLVNIKPKKTTNGEWILYFKFKPQFKNYRNEAQMTETVSMYYFDNHFEL